METLFQDESFVLCMLDEYRDLIPRYRESIPRMCVCVCVCVCVCMCMSDDIQTLFQDIESLKTLF